MGAGCSVDGWCLVAERAVSSAVVVVLLPVGDHDSGLGQAPEDVDVEAFVADPAVERFDVAADARLRAGGSRALLGALPRGVPVEASLLQNAPEVPHKLGPQARPA